MDLYVECVEISMVILRMTKCCPVENSLLMTFPSATAGNQTPAFLGKNRKTLGQSFLLVGCKLLGFDG